MQMTLFQITPAPHPTSIKKLTVPKLENSVVLFPINKRKLVIRKQFRDFVIGNLLFRIKDSKRNNEFPTVKYFPIPTPLQLKSEELLMRAFVR